MQLSPTAFDAFLGSQIGQNFTWSRASMCPCVNLNSGAAKPNCPACHGKGRTWSTPVSATAGMTQQNVQKVFQQFGSYEPGDAILTIHESSPMYDMAGQFDRIMMLNSTDRFDLVLVKGAPNEKIYLPVVSIDTVYWYASDGVTVITGTPPTVNADGSLTWGSTGAPPAGTQYSISGARYTEYFVWMNLPSDRNEHFGFRLPKKLLLRRFDLFGR